MVKIEHKDRKETMETKRSIPTTRADFSDIRKTNSVYVDKTKQMYDCMLDIEKYYFLARPRGFGKSLLCTTLRELFLGNKDLFKGLWIEQSDWQWETHPVIHLDMTFAAGSTNTVEIFHKNLRKQLNENAKKYNYDLPETSSLALALKLLIENLYEITSKDVVVIIDEYEKPILDLIDNPRERNLIHQELCDFYAFLKPLESYLHKVFLTGVYKFTQQSIFSNLNNFQNLTFDLQAGALVGYTEEEITTYFSKEINQLASIFNINQEQMLKKLRALCGGYHFGIDTDNGKLSTSVYNSYAINNVFSTLQMVEKWFKTDSSNFLIQKIKEGMFEEIGPQGLNTSFNYLENVCSPDKIDATSLLYYEGYATMHAYETHTKEVQLGYPNLEVRVAAECLTKEVTQRMLD